MEKTNTVKRITKAQKFEDVINLLSGNTPTYVADTDEAIAFIRNEIALLAKKNNSDNRKPTDAQKANEQYKTLILEYLYAQDGGKTCTEISKGIEALSDFNNQKIAALMRQLVEANKVSKSIVKGKSLFTAC